MNTIIVPVVLGAGMTEKCIKSALVQDVGHVDIIAIDNGSTDGAGAMLRSLPVAYWPRSRRSLNRVWNEALSWAFDIHMLPHVLVINNDLVLRPDTYRLLVQDGGGFVTGVSVNSPEQFAQCDPKSKSPHPSFSCFLIRREVWRHVGQFDERYWAYCSDGDYHLRMDKMGFNAYSLAVPFLHEVSGTMKRMSNEERNELQKLADADRVLFKKCYGFKIGSDDYYAQFRTWRKNKYAVTGSL